MLYLLLLLQLLAAVSVRCEARTCVSPVPPHATTDFVLVLAPDPRAYLAVVEWLEAQQLDVLRLSPLVAPNDRPHPLQRNIRTKRTEGERRTTNADAAPHAHVVSTGVCFVHVEAHPEEANTAEDAAITKPTVSRIACTDVSVSAVDLLFSGDAKLCASGEAEETLRDGDAAAAMLPTERQRRRVASQLSHDALRRLSSVGPFIAGISGLSPGEEHETPSENNKHAPSTLSPARREARHMAHQSRDGNSSSSLCSSYPSAARFFTPVSLMTLGCAAPSACVTDLCDCIGASETPTASRMCTVAVTSAAECDVLPACLGQYTICVYTAANGAKNLTGGGCGAWGGPLVDAVADAVLALDSANFSDSVVATTCAAELCNVVNRSMLPTGDGGAGQATCTTRSNTSTAIAAACDLVNALLTAAPTPGGSAAPAGEITILEYNMTSAGNYAPVLANVSARTRLAAQLSSDLSAEIGRSCVVQRLLSGSLIVNFRAFVPNADVAAAKAVVAAVAGNPDMAWLAKSAAIVRSSGGPAAFGALGMSAPLTVILVPEAPYPTRAPRTYNGTSSGAAGVAFLPGCAWVVARLVATLAVFLAAGALLL